MPHMVLEHTAGLSRPFGATGASGFRFWRETLATGARGRVLEHVRSRHRPAAWWQEVI